MSVTLPSNLTDQQVRTINAAIRAAPEAAWSDGMLRTISGQLAGDGPWTNAAVNSAIMSTFNDLGLDAPNATVSRPRCRACMSNLSKLKPARSTASGFRTTIVCRPSGMLQLLSCACSTRRLS